MSTSVRIEFPGNKSNSKEKVDNEVKNAICAMLNTDGGQLILYTNDGCYSEEDVDGITRKVNQKTGSLVSNVPGKKKLVRERVSDDYKEISFRIKALPSECQPCSVNTNLYYKTETEIIEVPSEDTKTAVDAIESESRKRKLKDNSKVGNHERRFVLGKTVALRESETTELKKLKDGSKPDLASRIANKSNKLTHYVSGFANGEGGHIYYGIRNDKVNESNIVIGQTVTDADKKQITNEVPAAISRMVWPGECGEPTEGKHWGKSFQPVVGDETKSVIVISVEPSSQCVFAEEPESYHVVDGKISRLEFTEWKQRLHQHSISRRPTVYDTQGSNRIDIPPNVSRCDWDSPGKKKKLDVVLDKLILLRNNGKQKEFIAHIKQLELEREKTEGKNSIIDTKLLIQRQQAADLFRRGFLAEAEKLLEKNKELSRESVNEKMNRTWDSYWMCVVKRSQGEIDESEELYTISMQLKDSLKHMLIGSWFLVHKAKVLEMKYVESLTNSEENVNLLEECEKTYFQALREASVLEGTRRTVVELKQRVHIYLAKLYLRLFLHKGKLTRKKSVGEDDLKRADKMLEIADHSTQEWPMTKLCKCEFVLVKSERNIQNWERFKDSDFLDEARENSEKALKIAEDKGFRNVSCFAREQISYLESLQQ